MKKFLKYFKINLFIILAFFIFIPPAFCNIYTVTNNADTVSAGTLRQCIITCNGNTGPDTIEFAGNYTIALGSTLDTITVNALRISNPSNVVQINGGSKYSGPCITSNSNTITGIDFYGERFPFRIVGGDYNVIRGCQIGLGDPGLGDGIALSGGAHYNTIGGTAAADRNIITVQPLSGISIIGGDYNLIIGNYIGTSTGSNDSGNTQEGILIADSSDSNTIGGTTSDERNIISGNNNNGILILGSTGGCYNNVVINNYIGITAAGSGDLGNDDDGIRILNNANCNTIGGSTTNERNIVSGNGQDGADSGIHLQGGNTGPCDYNIIKGNYVGLNAAGDAAIQNAYEGLVLELSGTYGCNSNTIGGTGTYEYNVISGNGTTAGGNGIYIQGKLAGGSNYNLVIGNYIGVEADLATSCGNGWSGINIVNSESNTVGGSNTNERNLIANNNTKNVADKAGIRLDSPNRICNYNKISRNSIYLNNSLGINLINTANESIATPVITSATATQAVGTSGNNNTIELFIADVSAAGPGEGKTYAGTTTATAGGAWTCTLTGVTGGDYVTATQTNANGSTSEFSTNVQTTADPYIVTNNNDSGSGSLRWCIDNANASGGRNTITFAGDYTITTASVLPTITEQCAIDASVDSRTITLDGPGAAGALYHGLVLTTTNCLIKNLRIMDFKGHGIYIVNDTGDSNTIEGCKLYSNKDDGTTTYGRGISINAGDYNVIKSCYVGTMDGTTDSGNARVGIEINSNGDYNTIGGSNTGDGNVISGNDFYGIYLFSAKNNSILGNYIGTNSAGTAKLSNSDVGISVWSGSQSNTIGGTTTPERNLISGNLNCGMRFGQACNYNKIIGNYIGIDAAGTGSLSNSGSGIFLDLSACSNTVGGTTAGEGNIIANNGTATYSAGITISGTEVDYNKISRNSMYSNYAKGIEISRGNEGIAQPAITSVSDLGGGSYRVVGTSGASATIEVFIADVLNSGPGEGKTYANTGTATAGGAWTVDIAASSGDYITATQTNANGSTSEFATNVTSASISVVLRNYNDSGDYGTWAVGLLPQAGYSIMTTSQCVFVKNNGPAAEDFGIRATASNWALDATAGIDSIVLMALFNSNTAPLENSYSNAQDVVIETTTWATQSAGNGKYEGASDGDNVAAGTGEKLYFYIKAPTETTHSDSQTIQVIIECRAH